MHPALFSINNFLLPRHTILAYMLLVYLPNYLSFCMAVVFSVSPPSSIAVVFSVSPSSSMAVVLFVLLPPPLSALLLLLMCVSCQIITYYRLCFINCYQTDNRHCRRRYFCMHSNCTDSFYIHATRLYHKSMSSQLLAPTSIYNTLLLLHNIITLIQRECGESLF
jgi:cytochrome c oxidase subunit IV